MEEETKQVLILVVAALIALGGALYARELQAQRGERTAQAERLQGNCIAHGTVKICIEQGEK